MLQYWNTSSQELTVKELFTFIRTTLNWILCHSCDPRCRVLSAVVKAGWKQDNRCKLCLQYLCKRASSSDIVKQGVVSFRLFFQYTMWTKLAIPEISLNPQNFSCAEWRRLLRRQLMTYTITSSPLKLLLTNRFYFRQTSGIHAPVRKRKGCSLSGRSPSPIADSFHVATMARKQRVKFTRNEHK
jgi:hypothetical protein